MKLLIVESPSKSKTIEHYLGSDYKVASSLGHIRDLRIKGKGGFGVDVNNNFKPEYSILPEKQETVNELKRLQPTLTAKEKQLAGIYKKF